MTDERHARGRTGEALAALFLELQGYSILGRNIRCADVEVDLVARRGDLLALVEVKLRRTGAIVPAQEACGPAQRRRLRRAAAAALVLHHWAAAVRVDIVGVEWEDGQMQLRHWPGAGTG